ncbi:MAG: imidazolonepropionase [Acidobacteria bacterium]|nr:imidazolonepropionase [Acidobacteriota bacterium]
MTTLILNATHLITPRGRTALAGDHQRDVVRIDRPAIAARDGRIVFVGPQEELRAHVDMSQADVIIDADGCAVLPGFVDPHTHAVFAGDRRDELQRRLAGATYAEIAAAGGGIVSTVRATREATEDELVAQSLPRLRAMARCGTTTCEIKSGYGLEVEAELRMLRAIRHLGQRQPIDIAATFMGAHEIPVERRADRAGYIAAVVDEMVPRVARESLAEWIDVFCEAGVFTPDESAAILGAGLAHGMRARIHADELGASGGSLVARQVGARSADHLVHVDPDGIAALRAGGVIATLLPIAAFYLKLGRFAPARDLIAAGVPVALATDLNPGGGFSPSMPFAMTLACFGMAMTAEEALVAATLNAACALDRGDSIGSLETGKLCDAVLVRGTLVDVLRVGVEAIATVVKRGRVVHPSTS